MAALDDINIRKKTFPSLNFGEKKVFFLWYSKVSLYVQHALNKLGWNPLCSSMLVEFIECFMLSMMFLTSVFME